MKAFKTVLFAIGYAILVVVMGTLANYAARHYYEGKEFLDFFASGWPMTWFICFLPFMVLTIALMKAPHARAIGIVSFVICVIFTLEAPLHYHGIVPAAIPPIIGYVFVAVQSMKMAIHNNVEHLQAE